MNEIDLAARLAGELTDRLRPFVGRPMAEVEELILAEVKAFAAEKTALPEGSGPALRTVTLSFLRSLRPPGCGSGE